ncbi:hypothetical protein ACVILK_005355 [Bradyrhizobium embrapense]
MSVGSFKIENKAYADEYLDALFEEPKYRSMAEVRMRADKFIPALKSETISFARPRSGSKPS